MVRSSLALAALLALSTSALAAPPQVPTQISYQGVLLDSAGEPRTGNVDLTLRIYDALGGGTLVYKQVFPAVPLSAGVFTVRLGPVGASTDTPTNPLTTSLADALGGDAGATAPNRFLEVTVGAEGALARTQILTAPYALRAATADNAAVSEETISMGGVDATVVAQLFQYGNGDGSAPINSDPAEGYGDTDGDGLMNFVDPDNDADSIPDGQEVSQNSNLNLTTPSLDTPPHVLALAPGQVKLTGLHFDPAMTVFFEGAPTPASNVSATAALIQPATAPHTEGNFPVYVQIPNGERSVTRSLNFRATPVASVSIPMPAGTTPSIAVGGAARLVLANDASYAVDQQDNGSADLLVPFDTMPDPPSGIGSQIAVSWGADGRLLGLRCAPNASGCQAQVVRDTNEDLVLDPDAGDAVMLGPSYVGTQLRFWGPGLANDPSGRVVAAYVLVDDTGAAQPTVLHDRDGNGAFAASAPETVVIQTLPTSPGNLGKLVLDPAGRVVYAYVAVVINGPSLRIAWDRNGDGDFEDQVGGIPEIYTPISNNVVTSSGLLCGGIAFDGQGRLAALIAESTSLQLRILRDLNGDGDFFDGADQNALIGPQMGACDIAGHPGKGLALAFGNTFWIDRNDDGDFADPNESSLFLNDARAVTFSAQGRAWVKSSAAAVHLDPY